MEILFFIFDSNNYIFITLFTNNNINLKIIEKFLIKKKTRNK